MLPSLVVIPGLARQVAGTQVTLQKWRRLNSLDTARYDDGCLGARDLAGDARRHEVLPGITGWAQVKGRNALKWEEKFAYDVWYVDHQSPWLDLKILAMTLGLIFSRKGVSADGHATMPPFEG